MAEVKAFYDPITATISYVVFDSSTRDAVVIDPVLDYDLVGSQTSADSVQDVLGFIKAQRLKVHWILETHAHADHLTAAPLLKQQVEGRLGIGDRIRVVQETFKNLFDLPESFATDGSQFDRLIADGDVIDAGALKIRAIATPGHTPACMSYRIDDAVFTGDALFMHDYGTGRCDFPNGSAKDLYTSVHDKLYALPDETRVFVGHDYQPGGREPAWETTIGRSKETNIRLRMETTEEEFVKFRMERDATLPAPKLLFPSVQVNIDGGRLPRARENGIRYLTTPLNLFGPTDDYGVKK